ncbi:uncharacterized protein SCODWIG_00613 [Saccharomycodes ludwigii]|uniref:BHLH domain-containing protein n=1 Tax=Saccharomycodes ludwigii TaxID=36035 RepID=A0A376B2K6_9ASCO|nr:uncharacterized protein SCODWIG_00613 [Saccharomycodes ludwigii]
MKRDSNAGNFDPNIIDNNKVNTIRNTSSVLRATESPVIRPRKAFSANNTPLLRPRLVSTFSLANENLGSNTILNNDNSNNTTDATFRSTATINSSGVNNHNGNSIASEGVDTDNNDGLNITIFGSNDKNVNSNKTSRNNTTTAANNVSTKTVRNNMTEKNSVTDVNNNTNKNNNNGENIAPNDTSLMNFNGMDSNNNNNTATSITTARNDSVQNILYVGATTETPTQNNTVVRRRNSSASSIGSGNSRTRRNSGNPVLVDESKKKEVHKEAEKGRRNRLNNALIELNNLLPQDIKNRVKIPSKATTVELACSYIRDLLKYQTGVGVHADNNSNSSGNGNNMNYTTSACDKDNDEYMG